MRRSGKILDHIVIYAFVTTSLIPKLFGAPAQWVKLETPHFELYTTAGEKKGREAILYFEQVRSFFLQTSPSKRAPEFPVNAVFSIERSTDPAAPGRGAESCSPSSPI